MIRSIIFKSRSVYQRDASLQEINAALKDSDMMIWVSLERPTDEEMLLVLHDQFHFHPLAIEDCMSHGYQTPKVDDFLDYIFIIAHAIRPDPTLGSMETMEINIFLGSNYMVTCYRDDIMPPIEYIREQINRDERMYSNGPDFLCHAVLDKLVDDYMPLLDKMDDEIDWLEDQVLSKPNPKTLERILHLKHSIMTLRRIISPQREMVNRLSRDEFPMIDRHSRIYFRDIYDHLVRIQDLSESIRDIVSGAMDIYLSSTSLRLNEVMKALTIVSTIFLPLSFVAGVYGMNFKFMPELNQSWGYPMAWLIFLTVAGVMLVFFKVRKWF